MAKLVSMTYANSIFEVAEELGDVEKFQTELSFIQKNMEDNQEFYSFLITPKISKAKRKETIEKIYSDKISNEILNFLKILVDKGRINAFSTIVESFNLLVDEKNNMKRVTVETVVPLDAGQKEKLTEKLEKLTGGNIVIEEKINTDIIGGVILRIGNEIIDQSIKTKLTAIEKNISQIII